MTAIPSVSVQRLAELLANEQVDILDVRTPVEYRTRHIEGAKNVPIYALDPEGVINARDASKDDPLYVICEKGARSLKACEKFASAGYTNVVNIEGGTAAWEDAGLQLARGKNVVSIERQVRIGAGSFVLLGALLAMLVHPAFAVLAALVGAGLMFSGITDTCGMAIVLMSMPWNKGGGCSTE